MPFKPQTHTHTITEQSRMISVNPCQTQLPLFCDVHTHTRTKTHQAHKCRGLTPEDNMSGKDLRTHFRLGWAIERSGGPLGCWSLPTLRLPLLLHRRSTASSWWGQSDRDESILCWHSRMWDSIPVFYSLTVHRHCCFLYHRLIQRLWLWQLFVHLRDP